MPQTQTDIAAQGRPSYLPADDVAAELRELSADDLHLQLARIPLEHGASISPAVIAYYEARVASIQWESERRH